MAPTWADVLAEDPLPWLLEPADAPERASALQRLLGRGADDSDVRRARSNAMKVDPIAGILAAQTEGGWWVRPGPGCGPKYSGTVWNLMFLDQLGADPADARIQRACDYVLAWCPTAIEWRSTCYPTNRSRPSQ
jgi:hypothetical protein